MKASQFNKMTGSQLSRMPTPELKKLVSAQAQTANRRLQNIASRRDTAKNAVNSAMRSGGRFSVKGKDTTQSLVFEAKRIQAFNKAKTGTVKGAIESKKNYERAYQGRTAKQVGKEAEKKYKREAMEEAKKKASAKGRKVSKQTRKKIEREARKAGKKAEREYSKKVAEEQEAFGEAMKDEINKMDSGLWELNAYYDQQEDSFMKSGDDLPDDFKELNAELGWNAFV